MVTGASRGIGAAIAQRLAESGAKLSLLARSVEQLEALAKQLKADFQIDARAVTVDLTKAEAVSACFKNLVGKFGPVQVLINNAGAVESASFNRTDHKLWQQMLDVNLNSAYFCAREALPGMLAANWGRIVNISSTAGLKGYAYMSAYCAAKHALVGLTRALALECIKSGVTVNAICPGFTDTDLLHSAADKVAQKTGRSAGEIEKEYLQFVPQGRFVTPSEIASSVEWLCRREQASLSGQTIVIAGGEI